MDHYVVFITTPSEEEAGNIAEKIVEEKLAGCVNIVKGIRSIYMWKDKIVDDAEILMIVKTRKELFKRLKERVIEIHSYDVPEIIALPIQEGSESYLQWLEDVTL